MDSATDTPGIAVTVEGETILIRVDRDYSNVMLSILLHSKFSDGPRMEFLTNPHTNRLIEALMAMASMTAEAMTVPEGMQRAFSPVIQFVEDWGRREKLTADESASLLREALYPYRLV